MTKYGDRYLVHFDNITSKYFVSVAFFGMIWKCFLKFTQVYNIIPIIKMSIYLHILLILFQFILEIKIKMYKLDSFILKRNTYLFFIIILIINLMYINLAGMPHRFL